MHAHAHTFTYNLALMRSTSADNHTCTSGRNRGLLELDLKLDDLLEMQKDNQDDLDLEYVQFNVPKVLALLNKRFARKKTW